jgi:hypothetical protein
MMAFPKKKIIRGSKPIKHYYLDLTVPDGLLHHPASRDMHYHPIGDYPFALGLEQEKVTEAAALARTLAAATRSLSL